MIQVPPASGAESSTVESTREASLIDSGVATEARESCIGHQGSYEDGLRGVSSGGARRIRFYAMGGTGLEPASWFSAKKSHLRPTPNSPTQTQGFVHDTDSQRRSLDTIGRRRSWHGFGTRIEFLNEVIGELISSPSGLGRLRVEPRADT